MKGLGGLGLSGLVGLSGCSRVRSGEDADQGRLARATALRERDARESSIERELMPAGEYGNRPRLAGTYGKGLPKQNEYGELDPEAHESLEAAFEAGTNDAFAAVPLGGDKPLANPQAALSFNSVGADPHTVPIRGHPEMGSPEAAAEMVEMYWAALLRDVPFVAYGDSEAASRAHEELTGLSGYAGPDDGGPAMSLFRDGLPGCTTGPYLSQFWLADVDYGAVPTDLRVAGYRPGEAFMTDFEQWRAVQRGETDPIPTATERDERRWITTGRDLATFVEFNLAYHPFLHAAIALESGYGEGGRDFHDPANPQAGMAAQNTFIDYGTITTITAVAEVTRLVQRANWYHKWLAYRRARPEEYGGRVHVHESDMDRRYEFLREDLLDSRALARSRKRHDSWLLPMAYPQGAPTHPSYPAGHAGIAGACGTVLKALFDETATLPVAYDVTTDGDRVVREDYTPTVGEEVNKLVSNHEFGRLFAGLHYRSDGIDGYLLGEALAVTYVQDLLREFAADPDGPVTFTSYTGESVAVTREEIRRE